MFGKNRTFAEDYSIFYPIVFATIYSKVGDIHDTEDLCQDIFIKYYQKIDTIDNKRSWLNGALRFEIMNFYRKKKWDEEDIEELLDDATLSYVNGFKEARIIITEVINSEKSFHDNTERALFELIALKRFTYEETGAQLGFSKRQVRYRYSQVVERILALLHERGIKKIEDLL